MPDKNKYEDLYIDVNLAQRNCVISLLYDMFPLANKTFIGVMVDNRRKTFSVKYIADHIDSFIGKKSVYFTGNIVKPMKNRCQKNISVLNDIYLDLDTNHNKNSRFSSPMSAYWQLQDFIEERKLLKPSLIINTTRGLQLHWFIDPISVTDKRIALWKKVEKSLSEQFSLFYSDCAVATDYARLLRFPYSVNAKTNDLAEILDYDGERYSIGDLAKCVFEKPKKNKNTEFSNRDGVATAKQLKYVNDICNILHLQNPNVSTYSEANSFIKVHKDQVKQNRVHYFNKKQLMACPKKGEKYNIELEKRNAKVLERYVEDHRQNQHCRETLLFLYRLIQLHITEDEDLSWKKYVI